MQTEYLIRTFSKKWLAGKLNITAPTLNARLESHNWKFSEAAVIEDLFEKSVELERIADESIARGKAAKAGK